MIEQQARTAVGGPDRGAAFGTTRISRRRARRRWRPLEVTRRTGAAGGAPRLRVAPPPPVAVPRAPFVALVLALVVGGVLGILVVNTKIDENAFRLDRLQQAAGRAGPAAAAARAGDRRGGRRRATWRAAARKLGLVEAGTPAFIRLPDGKVIGVPTPAGGPPAVTAQGAGR